MTKVRIYQVETVRTICRVSIQEEKNNLLVAEVAGCWPVHSRRIKGAAQGANVERLVQELMDDCLIAIRSTFGDVIKTYPLAGHSL